MKALSIITVNRNNAAGLSRTIESVKSQGCKDYEFIVIDGASTDGSVEVIKKNAHYIKYWVSEPDSGIYQGMNKGIRTARGEYCLFLNSGDWLCGDDIVDRLQKSIDGNADVYYSDLLVSDGSKSWLIEYPRTLTADYFISNTISHQNSLISTKLLLRAGLYREDFRIVSDWYFFVYVLYCCDADFRYIPGHISFYYYEGMSSNPKYEDGKEEEHCRGINDVFGDLGPSIIELRNYRSSVYGNIIRTLGYSRLLNFVLKAYRYLARLFVYLRHSKNVGNCQP